MVVISNETLYDEDMAGSTATRTSRVDEVTVAHAMMEHMDRVQRSENNSRIPDPQRFTGHVTRLFVRDFGMFTQEGNEEVSKLVRYVEDLMRRRVDDSIIRHTLNTGFRNIAKMGHTEVYDTWVIRDIESLLDSILDDFITGASDPLMRLLFDPVDITTMTEEELKPFRSKVSTLRTEEELYQLPVP